MPTKPLSDYSKEALLKQEKTIKVAIMVSAAAVLLTLAAGIWTTYQKHKFSALTVLPISMGVIALSNVRNLKAVQDELKLRG